MLNNFKIHPSDNVTVALKPLLKGDVIELESLKLTVNQDIPMGHKIAIANISEGENIIKYGHPIGSAAENIFAGDWVHSHNIKTNLSDIRDFTYKPNRFEIPEQEPETFNGFVRSNGKIGIRNEIWILPLVGCVNEIAQKIAKETECLADGTSIDGIYAFQHPYGCSQTGKDHDMTKKLLSALANHPNAGGVLVVGLGCENLTMSQFKESLGQWDDSRIEFLVCQDEDDEIKTGIQKIQNLVGYVAEFKKISIPVSKLILGLKCGGSDGLSGITANPTVGAVCDKLISQGGSAILTEVPEMFGAEDILMNRAADQGVFNKIKNMVDSFKEYFISHGQTIYENPSPGNKDGGISTLEDKSLGCVQKGGTATVSDAIGYADPISVSGLTLMYGPGNDLVSTTALAAAGAHMILFTTGRGTPFGAPVPTLKISSNTQLFKHKKNWIDFNAGIVAEGESLETAANELFKLVVSAANGQKTKTEESGYRNIAIFKDGITL